MREINTEEIELINEVMKIMQHERRRQDAEYKELTELRRNNEESWITKPVMTDYCGLNEGKHEYFLHLIKNRDHKCKDFEMRTKEYSCDSCSYRVQASGIQSDNRRMNEISQDIHTKIAASNDGSTNELNKFLLKIGTIKAYELSQAFHSGIFYKKHPKYLSVCEYYSSEVKSVSCTVINKHDACKKYTPCSVLHGEYIDKSVDDVFREMRVYK